MLLSCGKFVSQDIYKKRLSLVSCFQKIGSIRGGKETLKGMAKVNACGF